MLCLGNTLVHLDSPAAIGRMLGNAHALLAPEGRFVLQILNYDRIIALNVETLPEINTEHTVFKRRYAWKNGVLRFITTIVVKKSGEALTSDIPLYPLRKGELTELVEGAGYTGLTYYGGFQGEPHGENSFVTIAVCGK